MKAIERELIKLGFEVVFIGGEGHFYAYPLTYIANAKAIITLGGYSSLIELARFRKRGIIIPLGEHFEQEDNARLFMGRSGYRVLPINKIDIYSVERYLEEIIVEDPDPPRFKDAAKIISSRIQGLMR
jgi:UDP-N-acetylglucosamine:LPS N-acetylglucosamine transferase